MADAQISIGQVKRDISELVNRVAYGYERIVLTSRGKPKAAIVNISDYEHLTQLTVEVNLRRWQNWLAASEQLSGDIVARRGEAPLDIESLWQAARNELEERDDRLFSD